jgi:Amt family ammonium transporter
MGFNAGSTGAMNEFAALAILNSLAALCAGLLVWLVIERSHRGATTTAGAVTGLLGGLVAVTPGADILSPVGALIVGGVGAAVAYWAVGLKARFGYDDALDAVGVHLVPGLVGSALLAFLADPAAGGGANTEFVGILYGGSWSFLGSQLIGMASVAIYTFVISYLIATVLKRTIGLRVPDATEISGLDQPIHAETAYVGSDER